MHDLRENSSSETASTSGNTVAVAEARGSSKSTTMDLVYGMVCEPSLDTGTRTGPSGDVLALEA